MIHPNIKQNIELLQWFYRFLHIWKFLEKYIRSHDISPQAEDFPVHTWDKKKFVMKWSIVKKILSEIYLHPDKKNIFWYMVEINAFKGIFSITREMLETQADFQLFLRHRLKEQYDTFEQIIRFLRNALNHIETADVKITLDNFIKQKDYLSKEKHISKIVLDIKYADYFIERTGSKEYGLDITIDFRSLKAGQKIFDIIPLHQTYLLAEFCFNLSEIYRGVVQRAAKKTYPRSSKRN